MQSCPEDALAKNGEAAVTKGDDRHSTSGHRETGSARRGKKGANPQQEAPTGHQGEVVSVPGTIFSADLILITCFSPALLENAELGDRYRIGPDFFSPVGLSRYRQQGDPTPRSLGLVEGKAEMSPAALSFAGDRTFDGLDFFTLVSPRV